MRFLIFVVTIVVFHPIDISFASEAGKKANPDTSEVVLDLKNKSVPTNPTPESIDLGQESKATSPSHPGPKQMQNSPSSISIQEGSSKSPWREFWLVVLGGMLGLAGSFMALMYQHKKALERAMLEKTAESKVEINAKAYGIMKRIQGSLDQEPAEETLSILIGLQGWFVDNRVFLPGEFPNKWLGIRNHLYMVAAWHKFPEKRRFSAEEITRFENAMVQWAVDALLIITNEMKLKPLVAETLDPLPPTEDMELLDGETS